MVVVLTLASALGLNLNSFPLPGLKAATWHVLSWNLTLTATPTLLQPLLVPSHLPVMPHIKTSPFPSDDLHETPEINSLIVLIFPFELFRVLSDTCV